MTFRCVPSYDTSAQWHAIDCTSVEEIDTYFSSVRNWNRRNIEAFHNSGSSCFNYKNSHSVILMAICDADYNFLVVDIGASGRFSDSGIFKNTAFGKELIEGSPFLNIPADQCLPNSNISAPYVIVADEAFPLVRNIMRPFPGRNSSTGLPVPESVYNYRLSRARRVIENSFGILSAKWRIFRRPIHAKRENVLKFIKATVTLHNWIKKKNAFYCPAGYTDVERENGEVVEGRWHRETREDSNGALQRIGRTGSNNSSTNAINIRNNFKNYFNEIDILPWQNNRVYNS